MSLSCHTGLKVYPRMIFFWFQDPFTLLKITGNPTELLFVWDKYVGHEQKVSQIGISPA